MSAVLNLGRSVQVEHFQHCFELVLGQLVLLQALPGFAAAYGE